MEHKRGHNKEADNSHPPFIKWFSELSNKDVGIAGGKGASLAEMYNNKFPVPPGFIITAQSYQYFIKSSGLADQMSSILSNLDIEDTDELNKATEKIRESIKNAKMPKELSDAILEAYDILDVDKQKISHAGHGALEILKTGHEPPFVAVRSSATTEDLESISEDEHVLLKVNGKPVYEKIKEIYNRFGNCTNYNVEVPAMKENHVVWMPIKSLLKHPTSKTELYKIKTVAGREITITPAHTLISLDETNLKPVVTDITRVKKGTKIPVMTLIPEINNEASIKVLDYVKGDDVIEKDGKIMIKNKSTNWSIQNGMLKEIPVLEDFAYFLGLYVAEGSTYKNNCISITNTNYTLLQKIEDFCKKLGVYEKNKINKHSLRFYSPSFVRFLHETCGRPNQNIKGKGKLSYEKRVPNFVFGWSKKNIGVFLRGCFDGDGTVGQQISYTTTSEMLGGGMLKLLEILGISFYIDKRSNIFKITIPLTDTIKFKELIGFYDANKKQKLDSLINNYEKKEKHPEFKYNLSINDTLSDKIKNHINKSIPKKETEVAICKVCSNNIEQTSYYNNKKRYYCEFCKKAFYEDQVKKRIIEKQDYFDSKGRFKGGTKPWNYGILKGKRSLNELNKIKEKYGLKDTFSIIEGTIKWEEIKDIFPIQNTGEVYDFSVPEIENFAAGLGGIITHNSASFAGQQDTFLNVKGNRELIEKVKACFASLFTARATYYRQKKGFAHDKAYLSVVVQRMIDSEKSGVIFSQNPVKNDNTIVIEAVWGLGEGIVSGQIKPDHYAVSGTLEKFDIKESKIADKKIAIVRNSAGNNETVKLKEERSKQQVLTNYEIKRLAQYAKQLEDHYNKPQDIEFAIERSQIYIVQSRPITTKASDEKSSEIKGKILLSGLGASPGVSSGIVKIIYAMSDLPKIKQGDVLVTKMTNPDMVVAMQKASAIVTDEGGLTSHASIVSREMGIPAVVGTGEATEKLKEGQTITVDGSTGHVYEGKAETHLAEIKPIVQTKTKIKVIVDLPDYAQRAAQSKAKGVGLTRLEGIIASSGKHPIKFVKENKISEYTNVLVQGLKKIVEPFEEVWIRSSDIRSDEFRHLEGSPKEIEGNPMLGDHGIRFSLKHPDILKAELMAVKTIAQTFPHKKIGLMMPQIISVSELQQTKAMAKEINIPENVKIGIMVETPAAVQVIEDLCKEGISFASFGTNDLTQYTLAIDRNNTEVQHLYNEMHPAVLNSISHVIKVCKEYNVETSICGQAGSREDMATFLLSQGINSLSVNADAANKISELIAKLESSNQLEQKEATTEITINETPQNNDFQNQNQELAPIMIQSPEEYPESKDIEEIVLEELGNEYMPGNLENKEEKEIPKLNDAIPVDSEHLENKDKNEEKIEEIDLSQEKEWHGETANEQANSQENNTNQ